MNQSTRTPPPPFEGDFEATAIESQWERIADKPCIRVIFRVDQEKSAFNGRRVEWVGWLTPAAITLTARSLENCGWDGVSLLKLAGFGTKRCSLRVVMGEETADGKRFPKVEYVNALRTVSAKSALSDADLANFDRLLADARLDEQADEEPPRSRAATPAERGLPPRRT